VVNVGFEDLVSDDPDRIAFLASRLDAVGATGVRIAIGRLDWIAFPWAGHEDIESSDVVETGRDYAAEAIAAFRCDKNGYRRDIYVGIDTIFGRELERHPDLAGVNETGERSTHFASLTSWKSGPFSDRLADLAHEVAVRYSADVVNVTELMFDNDTFGLEDLADFTKAHGRTDWPRAADGTVDRNDPGFQEWRSDAMVSILARVQKRLEGTGAALTLDVRSPVSSDPRGRPELGQHYPRLLEHVDRLVLWNFPGTDGTSGIFDTAQLSELLIDESPDRYELEIGLWNWKQGGSISTATLRRELDAALAHDIRFVSVTPTSLFTQDIWLVLRQTWTDST
jgi:hypothetical protein